MKISFLSQGFTEYSDKAVGYYLVKFLDSGEFNSFFAISAFASESGIRGISNFINSAKENFCRTTMVVGVDQQGTSKEALEEILKIIDKPKVLGYLFYQREAPIFHPKIYLFEGTQSIKLIVGSSNLTGMGLFANVESSVLFEFDIDDIEGMELLTDLKNYYQSLFDYSDKNLVEITEAVIEQFVAEKIVPTEIERRLLYNKNAKTRQVESEQPFDRINIFKRTPSKIPSFFSSRSAAIVVKDESSKKTDQGNNTSLSAANIDYSKWVWNSGPLTERDLTIPSGVNTHVTASMLFKKGKTPEIDQRHYFRTSVFAGLPWAFDENPKTSHLEKATAFFHVTILGIYQGKFPLLLTHNTKTDTPTYKQKNSMTSLSWGEVRPLIAKADLIGKSAYLYTSEATSNEFGLSIE